MRALLASAAILLGFTWVNADTIYLKNGRRIVADSVVEEETRYIYETSQGKVTLPKSLVDHIERDDARTSPSAPPQSSSDSRKHDAPVPSMNVGMRPPRVISGGQVDRKYLDEIVRQANPNAVQREFMVAAYLTAEDFEITHGRLDAALEIARTGATAPPVFTVPGDARLLVGLSIVYLQRQDYRQARDTLLRARTVAPNSAEVWKYLGFVEYSTDRVPDAVESWKKSLSIARDPEVQKLLERAQRESAAEDRFVEANSNHFTLRFEGGQVSHAFSTAILDTLERDFQELERDLDTSPHEPITVILYPAQAFYDVTQAASWTGALFDGKIRVPIEGLNNVTPELSAVLKHEMTHSFVRVRSQGKCPSWLNEGLAQIEEGRTSRRETKALLQGLQEHRVPLAALGGNFGGLDGPSARAAYVVSLAATEMIRDEDGMADIGRILDRLAAGATVDGAMRDVLHYSIGEADNRLIEYLQRR